MLPVEKGLTDCIHKQTHSITNKSSVLLTTEYSVTVMRVSFSSWPNENINFESIVPKNSAMKNQTKQETIRVYNPLLYSDIKAAIPIKSKQSLPKSSLQQNQSDKSHTAKLLIKNERRKLMKEVDFVNYYSDENHNGILEGDYIPPPLKVSKENRAQTTFDSRCENKAEKLRPNTYHAKLKEDMSLSDLFFKLPTDPIPYSSRRKVEIPSRKRIDDSLPDISQPTNTYKDKLSSLYKIFKSETAPIDRDEENGVFRLPTCNSIVGREEKRVEISKNNLGASSSQHFLQLGNSTEPQTTTTRLISNRKKISRKITDNVDELGLKLKIVQLLTEERSLGSRITSLLKHQHKNEIRSLILRQKTFTLEYRQLQTKIVQEAKRNAEDETSKFKRFDEFLVQSRLGLVFLK